jgi:Flp pilus assembly protein TadD
MATIPELLEAAAAWCRSGQPGPAEQVYQQVLQIDSGHAEALAQLGRLAYQAGRPALALDYLRRSAEARPEDAERHNTLGAALLGQGRAAEAEAAFRAAVRLRPDSPEAHNNLGSALGDQGRLAEAESAYRAALHLRPDYAEAHNNLGSALSWQNRLAEAEAEYREAVRLRPDFAAAHNYLGNVFRKQGRLAEAEAAYREAVRLRPDYAEAHSNLGVALRDLDHLTEAESACREAVRLRPDSAEARTNLGNALRDLGRLDEAEAAYREALRLRAGYAEAHNNLGMLLLSLGRFGEGWAEYDWRWQVRGQSRPAFGGPAWGGEPLSGGTLLLWAEQGLGDTLQFVRYAALVKERVGAIVLECPPALIPLLSHCAGIDRLVGRGAPLPPFDAHAPLAGLPRLVGTTAETIPAPVPYLAADPERARRWRAELAGLLGYKVGIAWQGNPNIPYDRRRSFPLAALEPLARLSGVHLVVLQKGHGREQLPAAADWPLTDLAQRLDEEAGAFVDTAAVLAGLDLVVTCDSALAHLAGALGAACWVALPHAADWRWLLGREDSPWYPTLRLFRQSQPGDWGDVFARMAAALRERLN